MRAAIEQVAARGIVQVHHVFVREHDLEAAQALSGRAADESCRETVPGSAASRWLPGPPPRPPWSAHLHIFFQVTGSFLMAGNIFL